MRDLKLAITTKWAIQMIKQITKNAWEPCYSTVSKIFNKHGEEERVRNTHLLVILKINLKKLKLGVEFKKELMQLLKLKKKREIKLNTNHI